MPGAYMMAVAINEGTAIVHIIAILLVVAIIGTVYKKGFALKLGIVISALYWGLLAYAYSQGYWNGTDITSTGMVPLSYAFMGGFVPMGIGALISVVF